MLVRPEAVWRPGSPGRAWRGTISRPARLTAEEIVAAARAGEPRHGELERYSVGSAAALAMICNILDPDVFVFGGGLSNGRDLCAAAGRDGNLCLRRRLAGRLAPARWGDSSGVRGAARLWSQAPLT